MSLQRIPFEKQRRPQGHRMCGAAALTMVYRSLDLNLSQDEVWGEIARDDCNGLLVAKTHLLAGDAIRRGLDAVVMQAADPWPALRGAVATETRAILNHRLDSEASVGHFSVLIDVDDTHLTLHDPQFGPYRMIGRDDFLDLWSPPGTSSEISGHILIGIQTRSDCVRVCADCGGELPPSIECARCGGAIALRPAGALGCIRPDCSRRLWCRIFCPECDWAVPHV